MKKSILVVDDEEKFRRMFCYLLQSLNLEVSCAENGQEAVEMVEKRAYDLIFMDVRMPKMTGPEAIRKIKALRPEQKIVLFSSSSDPTYTFEEELEREWGTPCLYKPFEEEEIFRILDQMIGPLPQGKA